MVCVCVCLLCPQMLLEVVAKTLKHHGISAEHECFKACSKRLFDISKFYLKVSPAHAQAAVLSLFVCMPSVEPGRVLQFFDHMLCSVSTLLNNKLAHLS